MASQRDYNAGSAALRALLLGRMDEVINPMWSQIIARAIIDAVDADREKQKLERDT